MLRIQKFSQHEDREEKLASSNYKKKYRQKACQNLKDDFYKIPHDYALPLGLAYTKRLAKQAQRAMKAHHQGKYFEQVQLNGQTSTRIFERSEIVPTDIENFPFYDKIVKSTLLQQKANQTQQRISIHKPNSKQKSINPIFIVIKHPEHKIAEPQTLKHQVTI